MASTPDMREAALDLAALRWRVFPVHPIKNGRCTCGQSCDAGKHPAIRGWQNAATTSADKINEWWSRWPDAGIGFATGRRSGVVVIDVDGEHGADALSEMERAYDPLPATV